MIAFIEGILKELIPLQAVVEAAGLGYLVNIPLSTQTQLPSIGSRVKLFTHVVYREDAQILYGFTNREDRQFFQLLIEKVSGIGPKMALTLLSKLSVETLSTAIQQSNTTLLEKCPGIGKKMAERIVMELRDKLAKPVLTYAGGGIIPSHYRDAVSALITLGYKPQDADASIRRAQNILGDNASTEALIKAALH